MKWVRSLAGKEGGLAREMGGNGKESQRDRDKLIYVLNYPK